MLNTENEKQSPDFERWMRNLLTGIKSVRRWKNKNIFSMYGFFGNRLNKLRSWLMSFFIFFAGLFNRISRMIDPWRATPENVLEHSFKQAMIIQKIAAIEIYHGNPHQLDFYRLLQYAINHDLAESVVGDINYHDKNKNKEFLDVEEREAFSRIISNGVKEDYSIYFSFPNSSGHLVGQAEMELWDLSERIGYCYFMLEEILAGRLSHKEKLKFCLDVEFLHIPVLSKSSNKFKSVKEILQNEIFPKLQKAIKHISVEGV